MKRCVICGNVGAENDTICEKCGNPYVDMPNTEYAARAAVPSVDEQEQIENEEIKRIPKEQSEAENEEITKPVNGNKEEAPAVRKPAANRNQNGTPRRRKSGPQIYGQSEMPADSMQGTVRRNVPGRTAQGNPANRPVNGAQGNPVNRPVNGAQGNPMNRPMNGAQGNPVNRPMNGAQGNPVNRPMNGVQGAAVNRPVNGAQEAPVNRPMNGMPGMPVNRPGNPPQMRPLYSGSQIRETARKAVGSPLFFLVALLNTVYLASSVIAIFLEELNFSVAARLLSGVSLPTQFVGYMDKFLVLMSKLDTDAVIANLIMRIPDILFCVGLWVIFISVKRAGEEMSGAGFGFVKAALLINMIKNCIMILAGLIISVALTVAAWVSKVNGMIVASAVTLVLMIIIAMMVIMYYFCYMATFKTVRCNAGSGEEYGKVSGYVAAMEIILALTGILNLLSGIVNSEISAITGAVGKMGWMLLFAVWIFSYKNRMSEFEEE